MLLARAKENIVRHSGAKKKAGIILFKRIAVAACVLGVICLSLYLWKYNHLKKEPDKICSKRFKNDVSAG